jgi:hypothetical protein
MSQFLFAGKNCDTLLWLVKVKLHLHESVCFSYWYGYRLYFRFRPIPMFFVPNFRFRWFQNTDVVFVSGITVSDKKKYENDNGFSVFRSFPTVFIPNREAEAVIRIPDGQSFLARRRDGGKFLTRWGLPQCFNKQCLALPAPPGARHDFSVPIRIETDRKIPSWSVFYI